MTLSRLVCPGEGDDYAGAVLLDGVDTRIVVAAQTAPVDH